MKKYKIITIYIFFIILLLPILFINLKKEQISEIDNESIPEISSVNDINSLENFLVKRIGFRTSIIRLYTKINNSIFNKMIHPLYDYGEDNYVFFKMENEVLDYDYLDTYALLIKKMQDYVQERGSYFLYLINPTKKSVYKEYLPKGYTFNDTRLKYLKNKLDELQINYLDNTDFLIEKASEYNVFNKQYDAGHWNDYGAFFGFSNLYNKLRNDGLDVDLLKIDDYTIQYEKQTTLPVSEFQIDEDVPVFNLKNVEYVVEELNDIKINASHSYALKTINANAKTDVLFFRGSYFNSKEKFIANNFRNAYYIHNYVNAIDFDYYYNLSNCPKLVIFDGVEYAIKDGYYNKNQIESKEYNVLYSRFDSLKTLKINNEKLKEMNDNFKKELLQDKNFVDISLKMDNVKYVYLEINNKIYDFTKEGDNFYITLPKKNIINKNIRLLLINNELTQKMIYEFK